ncbi:MAG: plastocyanin/azurin family copper-binding protein [Acidimicrobiales bacterium]
MHRSAIVATLVTLAASPSLGGQIVLDRSPNLGGTWVADPGVLRFDFIHRFYVTPAPSRSTVNSPTFLLAVGLPERLMVGGRFSTRSATAGRNNEFEAFGRWQILGHGSAPLTVALTPAFNFVSESVDGEVQADWSRGRVTVSGAVRGMSNPYGTDRSRAALAGGAVFRFNRYVAIGGDYASLLDPDAGEDPAWSVGLLFVIPGSPHTFSLHASTADLNTIEGSSRRGLLSGGVDKLLYGFEFTIPLHLKRFGVWFGKGGKGGAAATADIPAAAEVRLEAFRYQPDTVTIAAGQAVRWIIADPLEHTVTFGEGGPASSPLILADGRFVTRFERPGTDTYNCQPHPFMKGVVVVR